MHEEIQMKTSRYTEPQILSILRQAEGGMPVAEVCPEYGHCVTAATKGMQSPHG